MKIVTKQLWRQTAGCLVFSMVLSVATNSAVALPLSSSFQQTGVSSTAQQESQSGDAAPKTKNDENQQPQQTSSGAIPRETESGQNAAPQQKSGSSPVGVAVAPDEKTAAITASRPAGAAIAPAKQRRTRSILIKTGLVVGACVAVGTVVALSKGSPSQPH